MQKNTHNLTIFVISIVLISALSFTQRTSTVFMGTMAGLTILTIGMIISDGRLLRALFHKKNRTFIFWFILFFVFIAIHYSIVHWDSFSFMRRMRIWLPPLLIFVWLARLKDSELLESFGKCCAIASVPIILFILTSNGISAVTEGERFSGDDFNLNGNTIALYMFFLCFFLLVLFQKRTKWNYFIPYLLIGMVLIILLTGARRAIIGIVLVFVSYMWIYGKGHRFRNAVIAAGLLYAIIEVLVNVDVLYDIAGQRMAKLLYNMGIIDAHGMDTYDYSSEVRGEMIPIAIMMFTISPIIGNGYAYFITHSGLNIMTQSYSTHNNYLEILVNYGLIGFLLYYSVIMYILFYLFKAMKKNRMIRFLLAFLLIHLFVIEPTTVNYCNYVIFYILYYIGFRAAQNFKYGLNNM